MQDWVKKNQHSKLRNLGRQIGKKEESLIFNVDTFFKVK